MYEIHVSLIFCFQCYLFRTGRKVVSPVKVTLTPSKEGTEEPQEEILTLDSEDEQPARERPPALWVRELLLTEQSEEYDSGDDPEFVPPSVVYETDKEYDEVIYLKFLLPFFYKYP